MADIVWSLRNDVPCNGDIGCAQKLCDQAANEIVRLRQVLENVLQARVLQGKAITDASNEIERLWAALVDCRVELDDYYMREYRSDDPIIQQRLEEKMMSNPARVALEGK